MEARIASVLGPRIMKIPEEVVQVMLGLAVYQILRLALQMALRHLKPSFYAELETDPSRKLRPYFVFPLGVLLTMFCTPVCYQAFHETSQEEDGFSTARGYTTNEKLCLGSRGILWVSELPPLSYSTAYVLHHIFSLLSLGLVVVSQLPRRPLYLIYASLVTELLSDTVALLRLHGRRPDKSRLQYCVSLLNALSLIPVRAIPIVWYMLRVFMPATRVEQWGCIIGVLLYCGYQVYLAWKQLSALGVIQLNLTRPAHVQIFGKYTVTLYKIFLGTAMAAAQMSTVVIFSIFREENLSEEEIRSLAVVGLEVAVAGLCGAGNGHLLLGKSCALESTETGCAQGSDGEADVKCNAGRSRWIQAGVGSAFVWLLLSTSLTPSLRKEKTLLLASVAINTPLGEGVGRIGCFFAGCCGSNRTTGRKGESGPVQLLASVLNIAVYFWVLAGIISGVLSIFEAGSLAVALNSIVRLVVEPLRGDLRGSSFTATSIFALGQLAVSLYFFYGLMLAHDGGVFWSLRDTITVATLALPVQWICQLWVFCHNRAKSSNFKKGFLKGSRLRTFIRWMSQPTIVFCLIASTVAVMMFQQSTWDVQARPAGLSEDEVSESYKRAWDVLSSPKFLAGTSIMLALPIFTS